MREIAAAVGIKAGSLYNHFTSKEEILWDLARGALLELRDQIDAALEQLPAAATPRERLATFVNAHVRFHALNNEQARLVNRQMAGLSTRHYREFVALRDSVEERFEHILELGIADGEFALLDTKLTSFAILQMCIAVSVWYRKGGELGVDEISSTYCALAERMVSGPDTSKLIPRPKAAKRR